MACISFDEVVPGFSVSVYDGPRVDDAPRVDAVELAMVVTGKNRDGAGKKLRDIKPETFNAEKFAELKLPGWKGNRKTKTVTFEDALRLVMVLPGKFAKNKRSQLADVICRYWTAESTFMPKTGHKRGRDDQTDEVFLKKSSAETGKWAVTTFDPDLYNILLKVHAQDHAIRTEETEAIEDDLFNGKPLPMGGVYFACSAMLPAIKIGATRRQDPSLRLKELSRSVPAPFELVAWIPTYRPFKLEREVHKHFEEYRIRTKGGCTEFFDIGEEDALDYVKNISSV